MADGGGNTINHHEDITLTLGDESQTEQKLLAELDARRTPANRNATVVRVRYLREFISEQQMTMEKLKRCLHRYDKMFDTRHDILNYVDFCSVMHVDLLYAKCEPLFGSYSFVVDDARTGEYGTRINMLEFFSSMMGLIESPVQERIAFLFALWDVHRTGVLDRRELSAMLQACHCVGELSEVAAIARMVLSHAKDADKGVTQQELFAAVHAVPDILFPRTGAGK